MKYQKLKKISIRDHSELSEKWVHDRISDDPSLLGLGDVIVKDKERQQPRAGRLDLLLQEVEGNGRYEVERRRGRGGRRPRWCPRSRARPSGRPSRGRRRAGAPGRSPGHRPRPPPSPWAALPSSALPAAQPTSRSASRIGGGPWSSSVSPVMWSSSRMAFSVWAMLSATLSTWLEM